MENLAVGLGLHTCKGLLRINKEAFQISVRYKNRINVQKPRAPHYDRAKIEYLVQPKYFEKGERDSWFIPSVSSCIKEEEVAARNYKEVEENPYERLLANDLKKWFMKSKLIAFFHANPIKFDDSFDVEVRLRKEDMYINRFGKHTVNMAVEGTPYKSVMSLFVSRTEIVFCSEPKVDKLLKVAAKLQHHILLAAIVENRLLSLSQLKALSQVPDLTTARAQLVAVLNAAQSQLVSGLTYHQSSLVYGLQQHSESQQTSSAVNTQEQTDSPPLQSTDTAPS